MNKNFLTILLTTCILISVFFANRYSLEQARNYAIGSLGLMPLRSVTAKPQKHELYILFIGNSYTFFYDTTGMILDIAQSDKTNTTSFHIQSVTYGGVTLSDHLKNPDTIKTLKQRQWDAVILQDQSISMMYKGNLKASFAAISAFAQEARHQNAATFIFKTWPKAPESQWYKNDSGAGVMDNFDHMFEKIDQASKAFEKKLPVHYIPIGDYWYYSVKSGMDVSLYDGDGSHASPSGAYLNALIFYRFFTGSPLSDVQYHPKDVSQKEAATLKKIAAQDL
jgi:hypothetical protein